MEILVLNGSPKGKNSVTLQTPLYLEKRNPKHHFTVLPVAQRINAYKKDFQPVKDAIEKADLLIFVYPVYTFLVPYQLVVFLEQMQENSVDLTGKFVTQISTSKHFFDTTAHKYLEENLRDLQGSYSPGLSADMEDLLVKKGQDQADCWFDKLIFDCEICHVLPPHPKKIPTERPVFQTTGQEVAKKSGKKVVVVSNAAEDDLHLKHMIAEFVAQCPHPVEVRNVREFPFKGGCIGCMQCTVTGDCFYPDGFQQYLREDILTADAMVYAFRISQHYTHSSMKCFDDRQFCNGHRSVSHGTPVGYIIAGDYKEESNLQVLVEGRSEVGLVYLCGVATDEDDTGKALKNLALSLDYALIHPMTKPNNFYGVGGTKIFRDMVYIMQGMMQADHKYYKKHGVYDFPQKQRGKIFQMKLIGGLLALPNAQEKMKGKLPGYVRMPYDKVIEKAQAKE